MATKQKTLVNSLKSKLIKCLNDLYSLRDFPVPITELKKDDFYLVAKKTNQRFRYAAKLVSEPDSDVLKLEYEGETGITHYNMVNSGDCFLMTKVENGKEDIVTETVWLFKNLTDLMIFNDNNKALEQVEKLRLFL